MESQANQVKHGKPRQKKEQAGSGVSRCLPMQKARAFCTPMKSAIHHHKNTERMK